MHLLRFNTGAVLARRKPPLIRFKLDFGKAFGGSLVAKPIRLWLDPFIRETLTNMVVWPNRIVVPMLPEEATGSLDHLYLRCDPLFTSPNTMSNAITDGLSPYDHQVSEGAQIVICCYLLYQTPSLGL